MRREGEKFWSEDGKLLGSVINQRLYKFDVDDRKHLLWSRGGVPAIDAELFDTIKDEVNTIVVRTRKGKRFSIQSKVFDRVKQTINFGYGTQYTAPREEWEILTPETNEKQEKLAI